MQMLQFLKRLSDFFFFIYMTAQNSSKKDVWIHYKWSGNYTVGVSNKNTDFIILETTVCMNLLKGALGKLSKEAELPIALIKNLVIGAGAF